MTVSGSGNQLIFVRTPCFSHNLSLVRGDDPQCLGDSTSTRHCVRRTSPVSPLRVPCKRLDHSVRRNFRSTKRRTGYLCSFDFFFRFYFCHSTYFWYQNKLHKWGYPSDNQMFVHTCRTISTPSICISYIFIYFMSDRSSSNVHPSVMYRVTWFGTRHVPGVVGYSKYLEIKGSRIIVWITHMCWRIEVNQYKQLVWFSTLWKQSFLLYWHFSMILY